MVSSKDILDNVVVENPLVNFFLIRRYALYGVSVKLYVKPDSLTVSRSFAQLM